MGTQIQSSGRAVNSIQRMYLFFFFLNHLQTAIQCNHLLLGLLTIWVMVEVTNNKVTNVAH